MRSLTIAGLLALSAPTMSEIAAATGDRLQPGAYEVDVRLELPHIDDVHTRKVATVCLAAPRNGGTRGLVVLSGNNPLAKCPSAHAREADGVLTFEIACPGINQAHGWASYRLQSTRFDGRIEMKMGGKNMTMTEVQHGRRIGPCKSEPHS